MSWKYMAFCDLHVLFYLYLYLNAEDIIIKRVVWESIKSFIHKAGPKFLVRWAIAITWCLLPRARLYIFVKITSNTLAILTKLNPEQTKVWPVLRAYIGWNPALD